MQRTRHSWPAFVIESGTNGCRPIKRWTVLAAGGLTTADNRPEHGVEILCCIRHLFDYDLSIHRRSEFCSFIETWRMMMYRVRISLIMIVVWAISALTTFQSAYGGRRSGQRTYSYNVEMRRKYLSMHLNEWIQVDGDPTEASITVTWLRDVTRTDMEVITAACPT